MGRPRWNPWLATPGWGNPVGETRLGKPGWGNPARLPLAAGLEGKTIALRLARSNHDINHALYARSRQCHLLATQAPSVRKSLCGAAEYQVQHGPQTCTRNKI
jgi:hypothetical protein